MAYCSKCGTKVESESSFCPKCGVKRREIEESTKEISKRGNPIGWVVFVIVLFFCAYIILDLWAAQSITATFAGLDWPSVHSTSAVVRGNLKLSNPTFVPVFLGRVTYDLNYGDTSIGQGGTGVIFVPPMSESTLPVNFEVSYGGVGETIWQSIKNFFTGQRENFKFTTYAALGPIEIPINSEVIG